MSTEEINQIKQALSLLSAERVNTTGLGAPINILKRLLEDFVPIEPQPSVLPSAEEYFTKNYRIDKVDLDNLKGALVSIIEGYAQLCVEHKGKEVLRKAVEAIYFNDSSDYLRVLYSIVNSITGEENADIDKLYEILNHGK